VKLHVLWGLLVFVFLVLLIDYNFIITINGTIPISIY